MKTELTYSQMRDAVADQLTEDEHAAFRAFSTDDQNEFLEYDYDDNGDREFNLDKSVTAFRKFDAD